MRVVKMVTNYTTKENMLHASLMYRRDYGLVQYKCPAVPN
jgi:hypothetical protein